jgi:TPR repeat protein
MRHVPAAVGGVSSRFLLGTLPVVLVTVSTFGVTVASVGISQSGTAQTTQAKPPVQQQETLSEEELKALRQKAEQGDATAQFELGNLYSSGRGVPKDFAQAAACYRKAAEQGHVRAQSSMGNLYLSGQGVPRDFAQAAAWYRKAAEQGDTYAQIKMGDLSWGGFGVRDLAETASWWRRAAEQGDWYAQFNLGMLYLTGMGVPRDEVEGHKWRILAAALTTDDQERYAEVRDREAQSLPPAQLAEAQKRASEWMAAFEKRKK